MTLDQLCETLAAANVTLAFNANGAALVYERLLREALERWREESDTLKAQLAELEAAFDNSPVMDCVCTGCPRRVPQSWSPGMCQPCATEDCEHTDGAETTSALLAEALEERDAARAEVAALRERVSVGLLADCLSMLRDELEKGCIDAVHAARLVRAALEYK